MANYASGRKALRTDDRTGFRIPYEDARKTWDGFYVHKNDWEPKHPQLTPLRKINDPQTLFQPRPNSDPNDHTVSWPTELSCAIARANLGDIIIHASSTIVVSGTAAAGAVGNLTVTNTSFAILDTPATATGALGTVIPSNSFTISSTVATGALGTPTPEVSPPIEGVSATGSIGTVTYTLSQNLALTGVNASGSVGLVIPVNAFSVSGVSSTGAIGTITYIVDKIVVATGVEATGNVGTVVTIVDNYGYGVGTYGTGGFGT